MGKLILFYPFGISSAIYSHMGYHLNTKPDSVYMEECNNGEITHG